MEAGRPPGRGLRLAHAGYQRGDGLRASPCAAGVWHVLRRRHGLEHDLAALDAAPLAVHGRAFTLDVASNLSNGGHLSLVFSGADLSLVFRVAICPSFFRVAICPPFFFF